MKIKTLISLVIAMFCFTATQAQDIEKDVQRIRIYYNILKAEIESETNELICFYVEDNKFERQKEGEAYTNTKIYFYYTDTPDGVDLKMIIFESKRGIFSTYAEYMFDDGSLSFGFEQHNEDASKAERLYQQNGRVVRYSVGNVDKDVEESEYEIAMFNKTASQMLTVFNSYMLRD